MTAKEALVKILGCGYEDVDMLLESNIDLSKTADIVFNNGNKLTFNAIYFEAFWDIVYECFGDKESTDKNVNVDDFYVFTNYEDTDIYIKNGKYNFYHKNYPDELNTIENYIGLEFEDVD